MRRAHPAAALIVAFLSTAIVAAQAPAPGPAAQGGRRTPARAGAATPETKGSAIIRGFVVAADTGQPLRRAEVRLFSAEARESRLATTDEQGRFEARELPAGRYTLTASKGGFVSLQYGQRRPSEPGTPLLIGDGQAIERVVIALPRGSVIAGRITDEFGEPIANASVTAVRIGYAGGARRPLPAGMNARDTTDDLGQYRLFGLSPGEYYVAATLRMRGDRDDNGDNDVTGFAPTYYPGVASLGEAQRVSVGVAQEAMNVSFALVATRLVRITGTVIDSNGAPVAGGIVMLGPADARMSPAMMERNAGRIEAGGRFRITNVPPGRYVLQARVARRGNEMARLPLTVGTDDVNEVTLVTSPGGTISGRVVSDTGSLAGLTPRAIGVMAMPAAPESGSGFFAFGGSSRGGRVNDDGTFELGGLFDSYVFRVNGAQGWAVQSVLLDGQDITDTPLAVSPGQKIAGLTVVLTNRLTSLSGAVLDDRGQAVLDASVLIFPGDDRLWTPSSRFIRTARPDQNGRYEVSGLPAHDDYLIVPVQGLENGQGNDPEFLASIRRSAMRFRLAPGEARVLDLRMP